MNTSAKTIIIDNPGVPVFNTENGNIQFGEFVNVSGDSNSVKVDDLYLQNVSVRVLKAEFSENVVFANQKNEDASHIGMCFFLKGSSPAGLVRNPGQNAEIKWEQHFKEISKGEQQFKFDPYSELHHLARANDPIQFVHMTIDRKFFFDILSPDESWSDELKSKIEKKQLIYNEVSPRINPMQQIALQNILKNPISGKLGKLMFETCVMQTILLLVESSFRNAMPVQPKISKRDIDIVQAAKSYLIDRFLEDHSLGSLSKQFGVNQNKLTTSFKAVFGTSIFEYINNLRMEHAKRLLMEDGFYVQEVAPIVGYKNSHHFSAAFKKRFGISPSKFKN